MSEFIRSTHATNSPRSVGRPGSRTRWIDTPATDSSSGDSSPPRVSTCTSTPSSTSASESLRTCRARPPSISGGYSQDRIRTEVTTGCRSGWSGLQQRGEAQVWRQVSHAWVEIVGPLRTRGGRAGVYGLEQRPGVVRRALKRILPCLLAPVQESPVACLERQELACGALGCVFAELARGERGGAPPVGVFAGPPRGERVQEPQLEPPRPPCHVAHRW